MREGPLEGQKRGEKLFCQLLEILFEKANKKFRYLKENIFFMGTEIHTVCWKVCNKITEMGM